MANPLSIDWIKKYKKENFPPDLAAGVTVAVMLVPQAMGYAMLAGLPPVMGLYASTLPLIVYALLGSSRQLAVGPVAMLSILVFAAASQTAVPGSSEFIENVLIITLITGTLQVLFGILRMGFVVNFISHAVTGGFTSAAALIILFGQVKHLLGISVPGEALFITNVMNTIGELDSIHLYTLPFGAGSIGLLWLFKKKLPRFPVALFVVAAATLITAFFRLDNQGVAILGSVPGGIPDFHFPLMDISRITALLPGSLAIFFVGFMESMAIAGSIATKERYKIDADRELLGLGGANLAGALFSGCPVTGGLSRSAVNWQAGAKTPLASVITGIIVLLVLLFLTPLFYYLPKAVLGAVIAVAVTGLFNLKEGLRLFKINPSDGWIFFLTFTLTLLLGVETGILGGIIFSLLLFIRRSAYPHMAELGYMKEKDAFLNIKRFPEALSIPGILIIRIDSALFFANTGFIEKKIRRCIIDKENISHLVLDLSGVNHIDGVSLIELERLYDELKEGGVTLTFSCMKGPVRDLFNNPLWKNSMASHVEYRSLKEVVGELVPGKDLFF